MSSAAQNHNLNPEKSVARDMGDLELLANIGYKQELKRSFSLISMIGFSFAILTCWTALSGALGETMLNGGPVALFYGWIGTCVFSLIVVVAMAEICSAYPVAGGQYSWILLLAKNTYWGRAVSFMCGWIQLAGLVCMGSTALYQCGMFVQGVAVLGSEYEYVTKQWQTVLICWAFGCVVLVVNLFGNKFLHYISSFALYWSVGGFIICTVAILACAPTFEPASFVFTESINDSGWNNLGMAVILGCMQSSYGMCCYDAPAHMSEEMQDAAKDAPRAMVMSVMVGAVTGIGFILAILFCIQNLDEVVNTPTGLPILAIFDQALGNRRGAMTLGCIILFCQIFAANALLTESSRSIYAFARDGAFPWKLNKWLMKVHPTLDVPVISVLVAFFFMCVFIAIYFGSEAAFFTVLSIASTGLYVSYLMPIVVAMIRPNSKAPGFYNLGKWALFFRLPGAVYLTFCIIFFFFPTALPVTGNNMNYCIVAFGICGLFGLISWFGGAKNTYFRQTDSLDSLEIVQTAHLSSKEQAARSEASAYGSSSA